MGLLDVKILLWCINDDFIGRLSQFLIKWLIRKISETHFSSVCAPTNLPWAVPAVSLFPAFHLVQEESLVISWILFVNLSPKYAHMGGEGNRSSPTGKCSSHLANMWNIPRPSCNESITQDYSPLGLSGYFWRGWVGGTMRTWSAHKASKVPLTLPTSFRNK